MLKDTNIRYDPIDYLLLTIDELQFWNELSPLNKKKAEIMLPDYPTIIGVMGRIHEIYLEEKSNLSSNDFVNDIYSQYLKIEESLIH